MSLSSTSVTLNGATRQLLVGTDASGDLIPAHVLVNSSGAEIGTQASPLAVDITNVGTAQNLSSGQVTVGNTATLIAAARAGRTSFVIVNESGTLIRVGGSTVTMSTGIIVPPVQYSSLEIDGGAAVYAIVASGTATVSYAEVY